MRRLAAGLLVAVAWSSSALAQEQDRGLERISIALQQPARGVRLVPPDTSTPQVKFGILSLVPPTASGEIVRVSLPVGELVSRAFKGMAGANQRRREAAARREVEEALKVFADAARPR